MKLEVFDQLRLINGNDKAYTNPLKIELRQEIQLDQ
jgi:hypothetical protein